MIIMRSVAQNLISPARDADCDTLFPLTVRLEGNQKEVSRTPVLERSLLTWEPLALRSSFHFEAPLSLFLGPSFVQAVAAP
jgi:hypothetical protein